MAVADLPDGFAVQPDPRRERVMRMIAIWVVAGGFACALLLVGLALAYGQPVFLIGALGYLLPMAATDWVLWRVIKPPVLKADPASVTYAAAFKTTNVPRTDLAMIFNGQTTYGGRTASWVRSYLFTSAGGKVAFAVPEVWFRSDDLAEFAHRLGLPVQGDFSQRIRDTVNETS